MEFELAYYDSSVQRFNHEDIPASFRVWFENYKDERATYIREVMPYKFELSDDAAEATRNICCEVKLKVKVQSITLQ